ncbi:MAG TPA: hypothetical protein VK099_01915, partial [Alcanivoracaceae bacterium]|nr:hypothetical protein [Alcanivoracaceae bacterium]
TGFIHKLAELKEVHPTSEMIAMSISSDVNGMASQPGPASEQYPQVQYPFTLFEGEAWSSDLFAGIEPITFEQSAAPQGDRYFDINTEGVAHYGMYADWVESLSLSGDKEALDILFQSAEKYLQMWEKIESL